MAQKAIKNVHHSQTMPGCSQPIVVKIADTERDKAVKKMQHQFNQALHVLGSMGPSPNMGHMTPALTSMGNPLGQLNMIGNGEFIELRSGNILCVRIHRLFVLSNGSLM